VEDRHNCAGAGDGLRHAKDRSIGLKRVRSEAVVKQLVKREGLRIEIEKRIGMHNELHLGRRTGRRGNFCDLFNRCVDGFVIETGAPGGVIRSDGVRVQLVRQSSLGV